MKNKFIILTIFASLIILLAKVSEKVIAQLPSPPLIKATKPTEIDVNFKNQTQNVYFNSATNITPPPGNCSLILDNTFPSCITSPITFKTTASNLNITSTKMVIDDKLVNSSNCDDPFEKPWVCESVDLNIGQTFTCDFSSSGEYYVAGYGKGPICSSFCLIPQFKISIDKTPPQQSVIKQSECISHNPKKIKFAFVSYDEGCGAAGSSKNRALAYYIYAYDDKNFIYANAWFNPDEKTFTTDYIKKTQTNVVNTTACDNSSYDNPCILIQPQEGVQKIFFKIVAVGDAAYNYFSQSVTETEFALSNCGTTPPPTITSFITPTTNPNCVCKDDKKCDSSCFFDKYQDINYPSSISCSLSSSLPIVTPTQDDKTSWCQRPKRTKGDSDGDGAVNNLDYFYYVAAVNGGKIPQTVNPNFNGDGEIGAMDREIIVRTLSQ